MLGALTDIPWGDILVPLGAAGLGAVSGATVARHLRREDLYVRAAEKINDYIDEASDVLNTLDRNQPFDVEAVGRAKRAIGLARFHSLRLESDEITNRLTVADFVLWDMLSESTDAGLHWAHWAIDDVMAGVVEFMKLPRGLRRSARKIPPNRFPNSVAEYKSIVDYDPRTQLLTFGKLRAWTRARGLELDDGPKR